MSGKTNEIDQPQRKGGDRAQESHEKTSTGEGLPGVDRIGLFKLWNPTQKEAAASYLPALSIVSGQGDAAARGNAAQPEAWTAGRAADRSGIDRTAAARPGLLSDRIANAGYRAPDSPAHTYELNHLDHRAADHHTPDVVVRLPQNFDPAKPVHVVIYNHGFGSNARSAYMQNKLDEHMKDAPANTVLVVPEWQQSPGSRSGNQGRLAGDGMFKGLLQEVFDKTPGLQGKTLNDVDSVGILAHSAGYGPTQSQIYNNGLGDKVKSITLLDALYGNEGHGFDRWLHDNIKDLGEGKKQFNNFFFDTSAKSKEQAERVKEMLSRAGMPASSMVQDYNHPGSVMDSRQIANHSIVFKYSNATDGTSGGPHLSMPGLYAGQVEQAAALKTHGKADVPSHQSGKQSGTSAGDKPADQKPQDNRGGGKPSDQPPAPQNQSDKPSTPPDQVPAPGSPQSRIDESRKILENPQASIQQKMSACAALYDSLPKDAGGRVHVSLNDGGKAREFEITQHSHGRRVCSTQMFARDSANHEHPVLRFVDRHNRFEQQRDAHGGKVAYQGKWWADHEKSSTVGRASHDGKPAPLPPRPETHDKPALPKPESPDKPVLPKPESPDKPGGTPGNLPEGEKVVRSPMDLKVFYKAQDDGVSCSAYSMAMLYSDQALGRPVNYGKEAQSFKSLAGTLGHGYRGDLQSIASRLGSLGLDAKAYQYGRFDAKGMSDLNAELDNGHTAVARVINPHTGNAHYIYVAGRDARGNYIIGDPDRHNKDHFSPVPPAHLLKMMSGRDGFVAGWAKSNTNATLVADSATSRRARLTALV